jgi:hypothetical protein
LFTKKCVFNYWQCTGFTTLYLLITLLGFGVTLGAKHEFEYLEFDTTCKSNEKDDSIGLNLRKLLGAYLGA